MDKKNPFLQEDLNDIFKVSAKDPERVISRENTDLEFKESFGWKSLAKYLKTCAAYANAKGGYIVFGIANRPHKLIGLSGSGLQAFEDLDPEQLTGHLNEYFSPEIYWDIHEYELNGKTYGLIYAYESTEKPVVCKKDADKELKEGDIYYRYRGRTERVKYPELRSILNQSRVNEQRIWMDHISRIAKIGVREAGIFDLQTGQVTGTAGSFLIDESLLSQLSFIKEGEFSEVKGKPSLKLIGNVEAINSLPSSTGRKQIVKTKGIRIEDIVLAFLNQDKVAEPLEFIKQICFETTAFLPIYYFINLAKTDIATAVQIIDGTLSRCPAKDKLIERLQQGRTQHVPISKNDSEVSIKKQIYTDQLKKHNFNREITGKELEYCLQAIRGLSRKNIQKHSKYIRDLLKFFFNRHYGTAAGSLANNLRRAICWVDEALYEESAQ